MPVTLAQFASDQIRAQQLTVKEFARRAGLGLSHAYQILRGERPRAEGGTFDAVARGLSMTPAEMAVGMGRGSATADPDEAEWVALIRQVPVEKRSAARDMLRGLATTQASPRQPTNGHRDGTANRRAGDTLDHQIARRQQDHSGDNTALPKTSWHLGILRFSMFRLMDRRLLGAT